MQPHDNALAEPSALKPYVFNPRLNMLHKLIGEIPIAMLTSTTADGTLISRPLQTLEFDADHVLWFATDTNSEKAA